MLDGKFGGSGSVAGPNYNITAQMGRTRGNNLFHSFSQFDLSAGEVASFTGPGNIQNILSRVTGGSRSSIDGTIRSEIPGANFFLINPNGVIFGANAAIDVSGTFAASSANYLKLADGARFMASLDADDSGLSSAPVSAFGFLGNTSGNIVIAPGSVLSSAGGDITLVGGDVHLDGGKVQTGGGKIQVASVQSPGEIPTDFAALPAGDFKAAFPQAGQIRLENGAQLDASGEGGGRIVIRGGGLVVDNSVVKSDTLGESAGQGIDIALTGDLNLSNGGQVNSVSGGGLGEGGDILIDAQSVRLDGGGLVDENFNPTTQIATTSGDAIAGGGPAKGGDITINAESVELVNSAQISSTTYGEGDAGRIEINADSIRLDALLFTPTQITANTWQGGGKAGDVVINTGTLELVNGATILAASFGSGLAGLIEIDAETVNLRSGGIITAGTFGSAPGGNVQVTAESLNIDGREPLSGENYLTGIQAITTSEEAPAPGGNIQIEVDHLNMKNGASLFSSSFGLGTAGTISVHASKNISLRAGSSINTSAPFSSGGDISVLAGSEIRLSSSQITASAGLDGGNIEVSAPDLIYLLNSTLTAEADSTGSGFGNGGNLTIDPSFLILNDSSLISRSSFGNGGNISILTDYFFQSQSVIDASAPFGLPGTVSVTAPEVDLSSILLGLPGNLFDADTRLRPDCAVRLAGGISSFTVLGNGGLSLQPGGFIPSDLVSPRVEAK